MPIGLPILQSRVERKRLGGPWSVVVVCALAVVGEFGCFSNISDALIVVDIADGTDLPDNMVHLQTCGANSTDSATLTQAVEGDYFAVGDSNNWFTCYSDSGCVSFWGQVEPSCWDLSYPTLLSGEWTATSWGEFDLVAGTAHYIDTTGGVSDGDDDDDDGSGTYCEESNEMLDCNSVCGPISWFGDGSCDDGYYEWNSNYINYNCSWLDYDDGDCL